MSVDCLAIVAVAISSTMVALGWPMSYYLAMKSANAVKRKELRLEYLMSVFRDLSNEVAHRDKTPERDRKLENALSEIQLFGFSDQVILAKRIANSLASCSRAEIHSLINNLRNSLRKELGIEAVSDKISWLRFNKK